MYVTELTGDRRVPIQVVRGACAEMMGTWPAVRTTGDKVIGSWREVCAQIDSHVAA